MNTHRLALLLLLTSLAGCSTDRAQRDAYHGTEMAPPPDAKPAGELATVSNQQQPELSTERPPDAWYKRRGAEINAGLLRLQPLLLSCYQGAELKPRAERGGDILVYLQVDTQGRVSLVRLERNDFKGQGFATCVKGALSTLQITATDQGEEVGVRKLYSWRKKTR